MVGRFCCARDSPCFSSSSLQLEATAVPRRDRVGRRDSCHSGSGCAATAVVQIHSTQILSDGSTEARKSFANIARDSQGRIYNERRQVVGPTFTGTPRILGFHIYDPETKLNTFLDPSTCNRKALALDDPVQHIDDYRALRFVEVLSSIRQMGQQVICTVEDPELADLLCRRLRSFAIGDGLRIELEYEPGSGARVQDVRQIALLPERLLLSAQV
jgi:hypothetical protein